MQTQPVAIVGVHLAKRGLGGCDFKRISRQRAKFKALGQALATEFNLVLETSASSTGREPCVLAKFADGTTSLLMDARDLATIDGDVAKFEKTLRAKLFLFF
ncbi:MAG: hypothetical protein RJB56_704 [Actinomycetota bacterium]|jgi:hypothetical protein